MVLVSASLRSTVQSFLQTTPFRLTRRQLPHTTDLVSRHPVIIDPPYVLSSHDCTIPGLIPHSRTSSLLYNLMPTGLHKRDSTKRNPKNMQHIDRFCYKSTNSMPFVGFQLLLRIEPIVKVSSKRASFSSNIMD